MKRFLFIVSFLLLFATTALSAIVGSVTDKMGSTWNERSGQTEKVIAGYELKMNDFLQTGEDGAMNLLFADETKVTLAPNTEFIIDEFAFDTSVIPIEIAMNISVNVGTFTYESGQVKKLGGVVLINSPTAIITVQGTALTGTVDVSGKTTVTLIPDSQGNVGELTVSNEAGSQTLTNVYASVTVISDSIIIKPPKVLDVKEQSQLFDLDSVDESIDDKAKELFKKDMDNDGDVDIKIEDVEFDEVTLDSEEAQKIEEEIITEELTVEETGTATTSDISTTETYEDSKSTEEIAIEETAVELEIDTSYYDQYDEWVEESGYLNEDNTISVWDGSGETTMDWEEAKKMYSEIDQAYFDAIGCSDCTWDTVNWSDVDWDDVDWDAYYEEYDKVLEDYGLTPYSIEEADISEEVVEEATSTVEGYTWEDFKLDDEYYANTDYIATGGPPTLTKENYCDYNGYSSDWCDQTYLDWLNGYYEDDWTMFKDYDKWEDDSKEIFMKWYGYCGTWPNYIWCDGQPKPWDMESLKDKYVSEWSWNDWSTFWTLTSDWYYTGQYEDTGDDSENWEDEYSYEDDYDLDAELELLLASYNEEDCLNYGYYWDIANQSCGTEWVDNTGSETSTTTSGEILNYTTGDITQTTSTTSGGVTSSETLTGRYTTGNNTYDADVDTSVSGYSIINRYNDNHRAYLKIETADEADIQILQDTEAQHFDIGNSSTQENITIIQTD